MFKSIKEMLTKERTYTAVDAITLTIGISIGTVIFNVLSILW